MAAVITEGPDKARETALWENPRSAKTIAVVLAEVYQRLQDKASQRHLALAYAVGVREALEAVAEELT